MGGGAGYDGARSAAVPWLISDWHRQRIAQSTPTALPGFALAQTRHEAEER
jgi:hypothetical protein